jgi:hypothetical protein
MEQRTHSRHYNASHGNGAAGRLRGADATRADGTKADATGVEATQADATRLCNARRCNARRCNLQRKPVQHAHRIRHSASCTACTLAAPGRPRCMHPSVWKLRHAVRGERRRIVQRTRGVQHSASRWGRPFATDSKGVLTRSTPLGSMRRTPYTDGRSMHRASWGVGVGGRGARADRIGRGCAGVCAVRRRGEHGGWGRHVQGRLDLEQRLACCIGANCMLHVSSMRAASARVACCIAACFM